MQKKILFLINSLGGLYHFRSELIQELIENNYSVIIAAPKNDLSSYFTKIGCKFIEVSINRRGKNLFKDLKLFSNYLYIIKKTKPDIILTYTIKPNIYGGLAASMLKIPFIANITGLGSAVINRGLLNKITLFLYKVSFKKAACIFFQNEENKKYMEKHNIIKGRNKVIPGSGVNLEQYSFEEYPESDIISFLFIGRVMRDKGINEFLEAAKVVKNKYQNVKFDIIGSLEDSYDEKIKLYQESGIIKYHGSQSNVRPFIKNSHATINPSYHEGMSNVLLESASMGRPVIASNIPGCKETFDEGISGFGFEAKNVNSLVEKIIKFIEIPLEEKKKMGLAGRKKMENEFDRNIVIDAYMMEIQKILNKENK